MKKEDLLDYVLHKDADRIRTSSELLDKEEFGKAVDLLDGAHTVYILGTKSSSYIAGLFGYYLNIFMDHVKVIESNNVLDTMEQLDKIKEGDVFVGISFPRYSMRTLKAMEFANDRNAKVISITDTVHSPMCLYSSCNLFARSDMVSIVDSLVAPLSLINALVVSLCLKCPDEIKNNLEMLESAWNNYRVYLNDEINFIKDVPILDNSLTRGDE